MSWTTHPFRRRRRRGVASLAVAAAALALVQLWARTPLLTALGALMLLASLWTFYFPVRWRVSEAGVEADYGPWRRRWEWRRFRAFVPRGGGAWLTPFPRPHPLERWRALWLPCPDGVAELHAWLGRRLPRREAP